MPWQEWGLGPAVQRSEELLEGMVAVLPELVLALVVVLASVLLGRLLRSQTWFWRRITRSGLLQDLLQRLAPLLCLALGLVLALNILNAMAILSAFLGAAGVVGLALGFALKGTVENFIASVMLSVRQPFRPSDLVDVGGHTGHVVRLTSRATILLTLEGNHLRIPNADVFKATITNFTRQPERRIFFVLGVDAADDPLQAIRSGTEAMRELPFVLSEPPVTGWIEAVGDSSILIKFGAWIDQAETDFFKAQSRVIHAAKQVLEAEGFTLPEPIYRLRIDGTLPLPAQTNEGARASAPPPPAPASTSESGAAAGEADALDVGRDVSLDARIRADRSRQPDQDLLSSDGPTEYGDGPG